MADHLPPPLQGRNLQTQQVSFFRLNFTHENKDKAMKIGTLPRGALVTSVKAFIKTAFSEAKLKIGISPTGQEFGEKEIKTQGTQEFKATGQKEFVPLDSELTLYAKVDKTVNAGEGVVVVEFITNR
ncbi:hypothetical protein [Bartonella jaculi]|uniref:Genomic island protein n=1 Tax=Bartonella jaculi TaxID=686226 RepID=A0ABP9NAF9_9HYPH